MTHQASERSGAFFIERSIMTDRKAAPVHPKIDGYVRPKQAAEILGVTVRTVWNWVNDRKDEGFPRPIPLSKRVTVFPRAEIVSFAEKQKVA